MFVNIEKKNYKNDVFKVNSTAYNKGGLFWKSFILFTMLFSLLKQNILCCVSIHQETTASTVSTVPTMRDLNQFYAIYHIFILTQSF